VLGLGGFVLLPWYFVQSGSLWSALPGVFGGADTAGGVVQALRHGRPWLWAGLAGLLVAGVGVLLPAGRAQGRVLVVGAALGLVSLLAAGFAIGARGWAFAWLESALGALPQGQFGIGLGGAVVLASLLVLLGAGIARLGYFRGDVFVASAVIVCSALLLLFVALPVGMSLAGAFFGEDGALSITALVDRIGNERVWGLNCLIGGVRCGVAWNTLFLALLTAAGTTTLGTLIALWSERGAKRSHSRALNVLALLPIITPPFVVGLGLILLFGRAGLVNQWLEWAFGIAPSRWFYGLFGVWLAQLFAFTPIAFMIMRGVVQGIAPSLEEAAQTLRASRSQTFFTVTLPLLKPGLANAFLVGFIESIADFGNPIVVGGQYAVLSTDIFFAIVGAQFDQGKAASLALILRVGQRRCGPADAAARLRAARGHRRGGAVARVHGRGLPVRLHRRLRADLGPRLRAHAGALSHRVRSAMGRARPGVGRHCMELALHDAEAGRHCRADLRRDRLDDIVAAGAHAVQGAGGVRVRGAARVRDSGHGAGRELHRGFQRAAVRAHRHRADDRVVFCVS
jgi:iron(III) transport system permease protein